MTRRTVVASLLLVSLLLGSAVGAGTALATNPEAQGFNANGEPLTAAQATANNSTSTPTGTQGNRTGAPSAADSVRLLPVQLEADFVSVTTHDQGAVYNTTGPFAIFSSSEPVDQVAIKQPGAKATVLEGGRQIRIQYEPDAAPVGETSLYTLRLWFEDGSSRSVDLYASKTSVSVGSAEMKKYRPLILNMLQDAQAAGYDRTPEGVESHYEDVQEQAQLLDSLLTEQAKRLFGSVLGIALNPLGIAVGLILLALGALYQLRRNRNVLEILSNSTGKAQQLRERLWIEYRKQQQTAADEQLREVTGIGEMGEIYWSDAYNVDTVAGLAELFRTGIPVKRDGEVQHVGGVETLDAEHINGSWLEAVCRDNRLPSPEIALSQGQSALRRMVAHYGMAHHYGETLEQVDEILEELDQSKDVTQYSASSLSPGLENTATGGDD